MKKIVSLILAACLCFAASGCHQSPADVPETTAPAYVYPGEDAVMAWKNPAYNDEKYAEGATFSVWVNAKKDPDREYSYSGTVHWVENHGDHIFSLLCLPEDYDGTQKYPLLLAVHGFNATFHDHDYFINYLTDAGFAVLLFDFRGGHVSSTLSDGRLTEMSYDTKLSDIRAMVEFAETLPMADPDNFIFLGHSQGGMMGAITACTDGLKDRFNGMLLCAPAIWHADYLEQYGSIDNLPEADSFIYQTVGRDFLYSAVKYEQIIWDNLKDYDHPVRILCGTSDELHLDQDMEEIFGAFGDKATLEMVEGGYHDFRDDVLPKIMPEIILPFLESLVK